MGNKSPHPHMGDDTQNTLENSTLHNPLSITGPTKLGYFQSKAEAMTLDRTTRTQNSRLTSDMGPPANFLPTFPSEAMQQIFPHRTVCGTRDPLGESSLITAFTHSQHSRVSSSGGLSPASAGVSLTCPPVAQKSPPQRVLPLTKSTFYPGQRTLPHSAGAPAGSPVSRVPLRPGLTHGCLPSASSRHASPPNSPPLSLRPLTCAAGSSAARSPWCCRQPPRPPQCSILPKPALQTLPHFRFPPLPEAVRRGGLSDVGHVV